MREICVPIPEVKNDQTIEIDIKTGDRQQKMQYRLESFHWDCDISVEETKDELSENLLKIYQLKKQIKEYDDDWELIQIFTPADQSKYIQVLFRKK